MSDPLTILAEWLAANPGRGVKGIFNGGAPAGLYLTEKVGTETKYCIVDPDADATVQMVRLSIAFERMEALQFPARASKGPGARFKRREEEG